MTLSAFRGLTYCFGVEVLHGGPDPQGQIQRGHRWQHIHATSLLAERFPVGLGTDPEGTHDTDSRDHDARSGIHGLVKR